MKKVEYIKCPRCELNYIQKKDKYCDVCKQEMKAGAIDEYELEELEEGVELCPICKVNYLNDGETICAYCQEEKQAFGKDDSQDDWHNYVDKSGDGTSDEDDDMDLLPVENDEIDEELDSAFAQDLDDDFADDLDEEDLDGDYSDDFDDFDGEEDLDEYDVDEDEDDIDDKDDKDDEDDDFEY